MELVVSSFAGWFDNYIYLRPTGEWSVLPHAGQIYQYSGARALFMGGEINFNMDFLRILIIVWLVSMSILIIVTNIRL